MVAVTIYVEGGGPGKVGKSNCRKGFRKFFERAGLAGTMPSIISSGSRNDTFGDFRVAFGDKDSGEIPLMLVDSEAPVKPNTTSWQHLSSRDNWKRPDNAQDNQAQLMVQCMESWFLADVSALRKYFGAGFKSTSLAKRNDIGNIPKSDVYKRLNSASQNSKKGVYHKGRHSFDILAQIDPEKVVERSPFAKRLVDTLKGHLIPT